MFDKTIAQLRRVKNRKITLKFFGGKFGDKYIENYEKRLKRLKICILA